MSRCWVSSVSQPQAEVGRIPATMTVRCTVRKWGAPMSSSYVPAFPCTRHVDPGDWVHASVPYDRDTNAPLIDSPPMLDVTVTVIASGNGQG